MGPISLGFLSPMIEQGFAGNPDGLKLVVGDTVLTWSGAENDIALQVVAVELRDSNDVLIAKLPSAGIDLSVQALLGGRLAPTGITLSGAEVTIRRNAGGGIELGLGGAQATETGSPVAEVIQLLRRGPGNSPSLRRLARLSLLRTRLVVDDEVTGRRWTANNAGAEILRGADGEVSLGLSALVASAGEEMNLRLAGRIPKAAGSDATLDLEFSGVVPALFDSGGATLGVAGGLLMPLSGRLGLVLDADGTARRATFDVTGRSGGLDMPDLFPDGLTLDRLHLAGSYDMAAARLDIASFEVARGDFSLSAKGGARFEAAGPALDLTVSIGRLPVDDLAALWPVPLSVNGRRWVSQNIKGGQIHDGVMRLVVPPGGFDMSPPPADMFVGDFEIDGASTNYLNGLTPVSAIKAKAHMTVDAIDVAIQSGRVDMGQAGIVNLDQGSARVTDFNKQDQIGDIAFTASGPARAALTLMNMAPLGYAAKLGIDPATVEGTHQTTARFVLPLIADLDLDTLNFTTTSKIDGLAIDGLVGPFALDQGAVTITVDQTKAVGSGTARLAGVPLKLDWSENFKAPPGGVTTKLSAAGTLDDGGRKRLGLDLGTRLTGPVDTTVTLEGRGKAIAGIGASLKLDQAAIDLPELGFAKPVGAASTLSFKVVPKAEGYRVQDIAAKAPELDLAGVADLTTGFDLLGLDIARARFGRSDFTLTAVRPAVGAPYAVKLRGAVLDLAKYMAKDAPERRPESERPDPNAPDALPDFGLDIVLDRVLLDDKAALTGVKATGDHAAGRWRSLKAGGAFAGDKARFDVALTPGTGFRQFTVTSGRAGDILRLVGLSPNVEGGSFSLTGRVDDTKPNRPVTAELDMRDFRLVHAPIMARILTLGSLTGIAEAVGGEGIGFEALKANVRQESDVLRIDKARAYGNSIGMTLAGTYDTWARSLSVGGTIVPSYGLNRFLNAIPLVGDILTGGEGGGLFAFNYSVVGPVEDPEISVNALSALAPGILRDIVSAVDGTNSAADAKAPPPVEVPQKPAP